MRIISKFKDYYDPVQRMGYDPNVMYIRKKEEIEGDTVYVDFFIGRDELSGRSNERKYFVDFKIIGFCGNLYQFIVFSVYNRFMEKEKFINSFPKENEIICYSEEDVETVINNSNNKRIIENYYSKDKYNVWRSSFDKTSIKRYFSNELFKSLSSIPSYVYGSASKVYGDITNIFIEKKIPIFLIENRKNDQLLTLNPKIDKYEFQRIKDPYTAYQEIAQYISGVLGVGNPETIEISDEVMLYKKGFDNWSFKKQSENPKKKRG